MSRAAVGILLVGLTATATSGQGSRDWRPEERAVISDYSVVNALAASETRVYVATTQGLGIYDLRFRQWEPPVSILDGYPREAVRLALADPAEDAVWLATATRLVRYRPLIRQWEIIPVAGGVLDLMYDRADPFAGLYVRTRSGWEVLRGAAVVPAPVFDLPPPARRVGPLGMDEVFARYPAIDATRADVLLDERLRTFRYTAAAEVPRRQEVYLGTGGLGVVRLDVGIMRFERLPFGLVAPGVGAVTAVPGGVWTGTDHRAGRPGFTFVDEGLQRYDWEEGRRTTGFGFTGVRDVLVRERELWAATDRGVVRFTPGDDRPERLTAADGLPDDDAYALAQTAAGVWVGTAFGLALVADDGAIRQIGGPARTPVMSLAAADDSIWVGTTGGLGRAWAGTDRIVVPPDVNAVPELKAAIVALALRGDTVAAASIDLLLWRAGTGPWRREPSPARQVGVLYALAPDEGGLWVGGELGLGFFRFADRTFQMHVRRTDLPGPVRDLAVSGAYLWVATEGGAVRFARSALLP